MRLGNAERPEYNSRMPATPWLILPILLLAAEDKVLLQDPLQSKLDREWSWLREDAPAHRLTKDGLEIRLQPGDANTVKNALVRPAPDRS